MNSILVTGVAGFIGSHLTEKLLKLGFKVIGIDNFDPFYDKSLKLNNLEGFLKNSNFTLIEGDICDEKTWMGISSPVDAVIHLAAKAGVLPSLKDPKSYIHANVLGTQFVLEFMKEKQIKKMLFASSSSVYGNNPTIPFVESDNVDHPISPYAYTKKAGELMIHTWHYLYQIDAICLRFFTVFGPRQRPDLAIRKFTQKILNGEPIDMYGDGSTARDYTFVYDIVDGIIKALQYILEHNQVYEIVNVGNHHPVTLKELIDKIYKQLDKPSQIQVKEKQAGDVDITYADISKAKEMFGYEPHTAIDEGLEKFIQWYKNK